MTSVPNVKMLINGKFVESGTSHFEDVVNPATQEVLARVPFSTQDEISEAIIAAQEAFHTWKNIPISTPARIFFKLQELIRNDLERLASSITDELGKIASDAQGKQVIEFYTQTKTITERWPGIAADSGGVNTTITLK